MLAGNKFKCSLVLLSLIAVSPLQSFAETFRWTDRGTLSDTRSYDEWRTTIKYRVEIDPIDICNIRLHVNARVKGKNSRSTTSYNTYVDGRKVGLDYGQTFSYTRPKGRSGKLFTIDGYNNLRWKNEKEIFTKDAVVINLRNGDFDLYDYGDGLKELNRYTARLSEKCKAHNKRKKASEDAYFKTQKVYYDDANKSRTIKSAKYIASKEYTNSVTYPVAPNKLDLYLTTKNGSKNKVPVKNMYKLDKDLASCIRQQQQKYMSFYANEISSANKSKIINWLDVFNIRKPELHIIDTRNSTNQGTYLKAYLGKDARWHIQFILGNPDSRYTSKEKSQCYTVSAKYLLARANSFYNKSYFQKAKSQLDIKAKAFLEKENKKRAAEQEKQLLAVFKKDPVNTLAKIEKNIHRTLSKYKDNKKLLNSIEFKNSTKDDQRIMLNLIKSVKKSHPDFYRKNYKRFSDAGWYTRYLPK